jgi:hypothetical protein
MYNKLHTPMLLLCALMFTGCGDVDEDDKKDADSIPSGPVDVDTYYKELDKLQIQAVCKQAFGCPQGTPASVVQVVRRYADEAECSGPNGLAQSIGASGLNKIEAVRTGRQRIDKVGAQRCLELRRAELRAANACDATVVLSVETIKACEQLFTGLVTTGGGCTLSSDCADELEQCFPAGNSCYGTCSTSNEGSCAGCTATQYCGYDERALAYGCVERGAQGQPCSNPADCMPGLTCADRGGAFSCVAARSIPRGGRCLTDAACASGLFCLQGTCDETAQLPSGASCMTDSKDGCGAGLACMDSEGAAASCAPPKAAGGACLTPFECQAGLTCITAQLGMPGQCGPSKAIGQPCANRLECASLLCTAGTCSAGSSPPACMLPTGLN